MKSNKIGYLLSALIFTSTAQASERIEVGFSPCWEGRICALDIVVASINEAKSGEQVLMAAYGLTSKPIEAALISAHRRGAKVRVLADEKSNRKTIVAKHLIQAGIPVRFDDRYAIMHNKFIVVGADTVETGSFNFTAAAATRNAENVVMVKGNRALASQYAEEWNRLWDESGAVNY